MTPDDILRIARAVFPDHEWRIIGNGKVARDADGYFVFDPLNNSADAFSVLAWIINQRICVDLHGNMSECIGRMTLSLNAARKLDFVVIEHDGTEAGLRKAIVEAAGRVVG